MVRFSLETGLRRSNVTGLQWSQVDLVRKTAWIHPDQAKARKAIPVPLSSVAVEVIRKQIGKHQANVFTFNGKPVDRRPVVMAENSPEVVRFLLQEKNKGLSISA